MGSSEIQAQAAKVALGTDVTETVSVTSDVFPELSGSITFALPDGRAILRMGLISAALRTHPDSGVVTPIDDLDAQAAGFVVMLSTLAVAVVKAPEWWYRTDATGKLIPAPELVKDPDVISDLWGRYAEWRSSFRRTRRDAAHHGAAGGAASVGTGAPASGVAVQ